MGKTILIVEDEQNIVDILSFNLSREGYDTLEAYDGNTGLQLALEQNPDLILLDLMLPGMNGFDVCRKIREAGSAVPILMLTAREEEADKVPHAHRPGGGGRQGPGSGAGGGRLYHQALRHAGAAGPGQGQYPAGVHGPRAAAPAGERTGKAAGPGTGGGGPGGGHRVQGRPGPGADPAGVRPDPFPGLPAGEGVLPGGPDGARVEL